MYEFADLIPNPTTRSPAPLNTALSQRILTHTGTRE